VLLPVNLNVKGRLCVLVGGGRVALRKCGTLLGHGARLRVVSPCLVENAIWSSPGVEWIQSRYEPGMLEGAFLVIAATDDAEVNSQVECDARQLPALVLRADSGERSDITFPATLRRGRVSVSFATDGADPAFAAALQRSAGRAFGPALDRMLEPPHRPDGAAPRRGRVYLVGAGPGDPGLITVKGAECLRSADVVIHDALIDLSLLDLYCPHAGRIDVSKRKGCCRRLQPEIHAMMIDLARGGRTVVRLKGGDPMIFGRGGEESRALAAAGIDYEVVPGVSSLTAAPAYAGIPVTDREHGGSSLGVYSLHRRNGAELSDGEWRRMAQGPDTLVLMMGKTRLPQVVGKLTGFGRPASTPVAFIADGTTARQRRVLGTLETILSQVDVDSIAGPGLIVVGNVVKAAPGWPAGLPASPAGALEDAQPETTEVVLIRHGEIGDEYCGRYVGRLDPPLSSAGLDHAVTLRQQPDLSLPGHWLSSPQRRAQQTAEAAAGHAPIEIDADLREIDFGRWEGLSFAEIAAADPEAVGRWAKLEPGFAFPEGESLAGFQARIAGVAERIAAGTARRVYVVAHGGVIRALLCRWMGWPPESQLLLDVRPASITRVRLSGPRGVLCGFNDLCHTAEAAR
jgi:uroporphyrin-III C-methyltransferase/precorrin-2 dehydrogenase/sirohydrochlorin ferrochelatase